MGVHRQSRALPGGLPLTRSGDDAPRHASTEDRPRTLARRCGNSTRLACLEGRFHASGRARRRISNACRSAARRDRRRSVRRGNPLPTEEQLATTHAVSRSTVRRAMQDLVAEGLIYRVAGRGTFPVAESGRYLRHVGSIEDLIALSVDTICEIISRSSCESISKPPDEWVCPRTR